jgi:type I restriction enzyme S subunit
MIQRQRIRVGDLIAAGALAIGDGYRVRNVELGPAGIPFVRGGNIKADGTIDTDVSDHILLECAKSISKKLTQPGDVAFITKGTVGRVGVLRPNQPSIVFAPQVCYWRVLNNEVMSPVFLFYLLKGPEFQSNLYAVKTHGAMVADYVSLSQQAQFSLSLPSIDEQRKIGHVLQALDAKIEFNRRLNETLSDATETLFQVWFGDFESTRTVNDNRQYSGLLPPRYVDSALGPLPEGWRVCSVDEVAALTKGVSYRSDELTESRTALVTLKSVYRGGGYRPDGLKPYVGEFSENQSVRAGELVVAQTDVTQGAQVIGRPAIVEHDDNYDTLVASLDLVIVRPKVPDVTTQFLYLLFKTRGFHEHIYAHTNGTTVLHLDKRAIPSYRFARPPASVASAFNELTSAMFSRMAANRRESYTLGRLRDALLPKLLSGEVGLKQAEHHVETVL